MRKTDSLLVQGLFLCGFTSQYPHNPGRTQPDTNKIKVKNVPLSGFDTNFQGLSD